MPHAVSTVAPERGDHVGSTTARGECEGLSADPGRDGPRTRDLVWVVGAVATAVGLALWGIDRLPLWLDEAISLGATNQLATTLQDTAGTMGAYYVLLDGWTAWTGTSTTALRLPSVAFVASTVVLTHVVGRRLVGRTPALIGTWVVALSPAMVRYGQEARSYALVALLAAVAWLFADLGVEGTLRDDPGARRWWRALALVAVLGVASHGLFGLQVAAIVVALAVHPARRALLQAVAPAGIASLATAAVLITLGAHSIADWVKPLALSQGGDVVHELVAGVPAAAVVLLLLAGLGAVVGLRGGAADGIERWRALAPVVWAILPVVLLVAISVVRPYLVPRYVLASVPALGLLIGVGVTSLVRQASRHGRTARTAAGVVLAGLVAVALLAGQVEVHGRSGYDWRSAAEVVADGARPGDALVVSAAPIRIPFEAAWRDTEPAAVPDVVWTTRPLGEVRRFDDQTSAEDLAADLAAVDRLWLVHQTMVSVGDERRDQMLDFPPVRDGFSVTETHRFDGGVQILLLVRD